jgi:hypothetical protein
MGAVEVSQMNKSASVAMVAISVIISLLSFFTILSFVSESGEYLTSMADDVACQTFLQGKSWNAGKLADFFHTLNYRCEKDYLEWDEPESKEAVYSTVADRMHSCWRRYGRGEYDFMSNLGTQGKWCFTCGTIEASNTGSTYPFSDFIKWTKKTKLPENESQNYYKSMNLQYANYSAGTGEYQDLADAMVDMKAQAIADTDPFYNQFIGYLDEQYTALLDLRSKEIDTTEKTYIVYRYDRAPNSYSQVFNNVLSSAATGAAGSVATGIVASVLTGPFGMASTFVSLGKKVNQVKKVGKVFRLFGKLKKFSKLAAVGGTAGGTVGSELNFNHMQYVDLMTQEQYYRHCGSNPPRPQEN